MRSHEGKRRYRLGQKPTDAIRSGTNIVSTPFGFRYTNDSRLGVKKPIRSTTIARPRPDPIEQAA